MTDLSQKTIVVVGASRGLGHGIATALAEAGAHVVAVSRTLAALPANVKLEVADGAEATAAAIAVAVLGMAAASLLLGSRRAPEAVVAEPAPSVA